MEKREVRNKIKKGLILAGLKIRSLDKYDCIIVFKPTEKDLNKIEKIVGEFIPLSYRREENKNITIFY